MAEQIVMQHLPAMELDPFRHKQLIAVEVIPAIRPLSTRKHQIHNHLYMERERARCPMQT